MKYFSMFTGIGGFELGIQNAYREKVRRFQEDSQRVDAARSGLFTEKGQDIDAAFRLLSASPSDLINQRPLCVGYSEIDKHAIATYEKNFGKEIKNYGDATTINTAELPDFDLLVGGFPCQAFSVAGKRAGFNDTRGTLIFDVVRILRDKRPRYFVLENVKGLLSHDSGKTFSHILEILTDSGYDVSWSVHNSKNYGVPQNRERIYLIGSLRGERRPEVFPLGGENQDDSRVVGETVSRTIASQAGGLGAKTGLYAVPEAKIRRLTPLECERLQGFPSDWTIGSDTQRYKQCGNAVTVNVVEYVVSEMFNPTQS